MLKQPQLADVLFHTHAPEPEEISTSEEYEALTPSIISPEESLVYTDALNFACSRGDIRNIAVTGAYGAGKSSVLRTWKECPDNDLRIMTVSLADFEMQSASRPKVEPADKEVNTSSADDKKAAAEEKTIEYSILQQLLYKEKKSALPYSRIERITDISSFQVARVAADLLLVLSVMLAGLLCLFPAYVTNKLSLPGFISQYLIENTVVRLVLAGIMLFTALFLSVRKLHRIGLFDRRVSVDKIDMLKGAISTRPSSPSLLNVYIDEIVYFFEQTGHNVVIFEDLDRHNDGAIFIKLREINQIINNTRPDDEPVRFIYAVRDGLFSTAEARTKFFDFVIPVIPVMDSENAAEHFSSMFRETELADTDFSKCVSRLALFIPDMRIMRNIANEFRVYQNLVNGSENITRLLSMIAYKNIFSEDYHGIDERKSVLYLFVRAFVSGELKKDPEKLKLDEINLIQKEIDGLLSDEAENATEIRKSILSEYVTPKTEKKILFHFGGADIFELGELSEKEELFNKLQTVDTLYLWSADRRTNVFTIEQNAVSEMIDCYENRKKSLDLKTQGEISRLNQKIKTIQGEINKLHQANMADLVRASGSENFFQWVSENCKFEESVPEKIKKRNDCLDFLYFLLSNNYIAPDYMFFRSVFKPGSLSHEDNEFIKEVSRSRTYRQTSGMPLRKIDNVVAKLESLGMMMEPGAWHPDVLIYMLENCLEKLKPVFLAQVDDESCLIQLIEQTFINWTVPQRINYLRNLTQGDDMARSFMRCLVFMNDNKIASELLILYLCSSVTAWRSDTVDMRNWAQIILRDCSSFPDQVPEKYGRNFIKSLKNKAIEVLTLDVCTSEQGKEIVRDIATYKLWSYSKSAFKSIIIILSENSGLNPDEIMKKPLSTVRNTKIQGLYETVMSSIDPFIMDFFLRSEDYDRIPELLNNKDVSFVLVCEIILKMKFTIFDVKTIKNRKGTVEKFKNSEVSYDIYELLLENDRIKISWENVLFMAEMEDELEISSPGLAVWFDRNHSEFEAPMRRLTDDNLHLIFNLLFNSGAMSEEGRIHLLNLFGFPYTVIPPYMHSDSIRCLIEQKRVDPTQENFDDIRQRYSEEPKIRAPLLAGLIFQNPSLLQFPEVVMMENDVVDEFLARELFLGDSLADTFQAKILSWIWDYNQEVFRDSVSLPAARLAELSPHLESDDLRRHLLVRCLEEDDLCSDEDIIVILKSFSDAVYQLFISDKSRRSLKHNDPFWQVASLLHKMGFIRSLSWNEERDRIWFIPHNSPVFIRT
ncbi:YobI family P-loop NTPase [Pantoea ananatis]|uniref:YobI family P-loop NTPase n=1 Tax=Pantoea ananas TaxID=553 RepID=UPI0011A586B6|nr:pcar [Pantoea ananatis]